jgi:hypothetical protein
VDNFLFGNLPRLFDLFFYLYYNYSKNQKGAVMKGKGASHILVILVLSLLMIFVNSCAVGYVRIPIDAANVPPFSYLADDPLRGEIYVEGSDSWGAKRVYVYVYVDGRIVGAGSPPYWVRVAVGGLGRHEISAVAKVWSYSANHYLPAGHFSATFEVRPNSRCDDFGMCWKARVSSYGISVY